MDKLDKLNKWLVFRGQELPGLTSCLTGRLKEVGRTRASVRLRMMHLVRGRFGLLLESQDFFLGNSSLGKDS
jgi:hypothetical protein